MSSGGNFEREVGSLHDPTSRVYSNGDSILRGLSESSADGVRSLMDAPFFARRVADGSLIDAKFEDVSDSGLEEWSHLVSHRRLPVISWPHEWSFSMLQDAALLQLDISLDALASGISLKDGTPYNVQFEGSKPIFIDVGSFDRVTTPKPWLGYRQYCDMFLDPLLVQAYTGLPARGVLRGSVRGLPAEITRKLLPSRAKFRWGVFTNVILHAWFSRRHKDDDSDVVTDISKAGFSPAIAKAQLQKLRKLVASLEWESGASVWSGYTDREHYEGDDLPIKAKFVSEVAASNLRDRVLDLGANDGYFSQCVRDAAAHVIAVDNDELVIDRLYKKLRSEGDTKITPLCIDLSDPGGGLGWMGTQRTSMIDRLRSDLVLALALIHHVVISDSVPIPMFLAMVKALGDEAVVEFPCEDDPKVIRLIRNKAGQATHPYSRAVFEAAAKEIFDIERVTELPSGTRVLYHLVVKK